MSNWLTGIIVLLIIVILADGLRRTWSMRSNRIRMSPAMKKRARETEPEVGDEDIVAPSYTSELPNGGARVVGYRDPLEAAEVEQKLHYRAPKEPRRREEAVKRTPEQARLNLEESVPILMESVAHEETAQHELLAEQSFSARDDFDEDDNNRHPRSSNHNEDDYDYDDEEDYDEDDYSEEDYEEDDYEDEEELDNEAEEKAAAPSADPEEVFIINIMAHKGQDFNGSELLDIVLKCGLRYGSMDIFHRYRELKGEGPLLFSMANMVKPGTFDLDAMDDFTTPGISLFMTLPIDADSMQSFDLMVETAQAIAQTLNGELKDEQRSAMTRQTLEHCRQRISDFERKKLFRRPR